ARASGPRSPEPRHLFLAPHVPLRERPPRDLRRGGRDRPCRRRLCEERISPDRPDGRDRQQRQFPQERTLDPGGLGHEHGRRRGESVMFKSGNQITRRTMLKGLLGGIAVSVALPPLEAFMNRNGTAYAGGSAFPTRFGIWFWGNGILPD